MVFCNGEEFAASETGWINISKTLSSDDNDLEITGLVPVNYLEPIEDHNSDSNETVDGGRSNFTYE